MVFSIEYLINYIYFILLGEEMTKLYTVQSNPEKDSQDEVPRTYFILGRIISWI
jgi:hypothetical protein